MVANRRVLRRSRSQHALEVHLFLARVVAVTVGRRAPVPASARSRCRPVPPAVRDRTRGANTGDRRPPRRRRCCPFRNVHGQPRPNSAPAHRENGAAADAILGSVTPDLTATGAEHVKRLEARARRRRTHGRAEAIGVHQHRLSLARLAGAAKRRATPQNPNDAMEWAETDSPWRTHSEREDTTPACGAARVSPIEWGARELGCAE